MTWYHPSRRQVAAGLGILPFLPTPLLASTGARLSEAARALDIHIGTAVNYLDTPPEADYLGLIARECTAVTPENAGKWKWIEPTPDEEERWTAMDDTVDFASRNGLVVNWHTLMWQNGGMPDFMKLPEEQRPDDHPSYDPYYSPDGTLTSDNYWDLYCDFVARIADRYDDIFYRVDVANEPFLPHGSWLPDGLIASDNSRKGNWWHVAGGPDGPEWMDQFFDEARRKFPSANLVVNEFSVEAVHSQHREKREALLAWLEGAVARGVPIDGVGLQSHLRAHYQYDVSAMTEFAQRMNDLGLKIFITEMDVDTRELPENISTKDRDRMAAELAALHVQTMLDHGDLREITWWGLSSGHSFLTKRGGEEAALEPTLFNAELDPMPMYDAVATVLEAVA